MTRLTLLTQTDCGYCAHAKDILHRLQTEFDYVVDEVDLKSDTGRALATQHAILFAPGLLMDGQLFGFGRLSERKLRKTLTRRDPATIPGDGR